MLSNTFLQSASFPPSTVAFKLTDDPLEIFGLFYIVYTICKCLYCNFKYFTVPLFGLISFMSVLIGVRYLWKLFIIQVIHWASIATTILSIDLKPYLGCFFTGVICSVSFFLYFIDLWAINQPTGVATQDPSLKVKATKSSESTVSTATDINSIDVPINKESITFIYQHVPDAVQPIITEVFNPLEDVSSGGLQEARSINNEDWTMQQTLSNEYNRFPDLDQSDVVVLSVSPIELGLGRSNNNVKSICSDQVEYDFEKRCNLRSVVRLNGHENQIDQIMPKVTPHNVTEVHKSILSLNTGVEDKVAVKEEIESLINQSPQKDDFENGGSSENEGESRACSGKDTDVKEDFSMMRNLPPLQPNELEWVIEDFLQFQDPNAEVDLYSPAKTYNSITFQLSVVPPSKVTVYDSDTTEPEPAYVGIYLHVNPDDCFPRDGDQWSMQKSNYQIAALSWKNWKKHSKINRSSYVFCSFHGNRGWPNFIQKELLVPGELLGPDGQLVLRAQLCPKPAEVNFSSNNLREFGYLGIRKQAASCYLNSLVQTLFHIGKFRESVFKLTVDNDKKVTDFLQSFVGLLFDLNSTNEEKEAKNSLQPFDKTRITDDKIKAAFDDYLNAISEDQQQSNDISTALQFLFLHLHSANDTANTDDFLKSLGWDSNESLTKHDAPKLNRLLCDRLEKQMKGTPMEGAIKQLFMGEMESYIECVNVEYMSSRKKKLYNLQVDVKSNQNLLQSLKKYTAEEMLEGDNAYDAEEYGKQPARKGVRFLRFPPVLQFHLNRFILDSSQKVTVKVNQYFEYPEILDLDEILPGSGKYELFCVIVHEGDIVDGHYYVINRPGGRPFWIRFDDEKVYPVSPNAALADCFGGHDKVCYDYTAAPDDLSCVGQEGKLSHPPAKPHAAYMLFYVKCDLASEILAEPIPEEVNDYLLKRFRWEEYQKKNQMLIRQPVRSRIR